MLSEKLWKLLFSTLGLVHLSSPNYTRSGKKKLNESMLRKVTKVHVCMSNVLAFLSKPERTS